MIDGSDLAKPADVSTEEKREAVSKAKQLLNKRLKVKFKPCRLVTFSAISFHPYMACRSLSRTVVSSSGTCYAWTNKET